MRISMQPHRHHSEDNFEASLYLVTAAVFGTILGIALFLAAFA